MSLTLDALTCESDQDKLIMFGSIEIAKDRVGLERAKELLAILSATVALLEAEPLAEVTQKAPESPVSDNPFA
jgi:hypothetical protein